MRFLRVLLPGVFAAAALALASDAGAQATPSPVPAKAGKSAPAVPATGHPTHGSEAASHSAVLKAECQAMMARNQETQDKLKAMDATMDKLVAEMNAARGSNEGDAMEKPMAAVLNELVVQRKAFFGMMAEMQPAMMAHMAHHMHGTMGAMECPMMKAGPAPDAKAGEKKPGM